MIIKYSLFFFQLAQAAGIARRLVNSQIRTTSIRNWLRDGRSHLDVMKITRQRNVNTVRHYDPAASTSTRLEMGSAMWGKQTPSATVVDEVETNAISFEPIPNPVQVQVGAAQEFNCRFCPEKKPSMQEIQKHELDFHGEKKTLNCRFCPEKKTSIEELQKHEMDFHGEYRFQYGKKNTEFASVTPW